MILGGLTSLLSDSGEFCAGRLCRVALPGKKWLPDMDLNHDKQIQSLLCYRYTIGQMETENLRNLNAESSLASS